MTCAPRLWKPWPRGCPQDWGGGFRADRRIRVQAEGATWKALTCIQPTGSSLPDQRKESRERGKEVKKSRRDGRGPSSFPISPVMTKVITFVFTVIGQCLNVQDPVLISFVASLLYRVLAWLTGPPKPCPACSSRSPRSLPTAGSDFLGNHKGSRRCVSWVSGPLMRI